MTKPLIPLSISTAIVAILARSSLCAAFVHVNVRPSSALRPTSRTSSALSALDPVTYLRTEWVSAALCTNQTPRSADKVLQLGCEDGRVVNFVPRTVREIITSSAERKDSLEKGGLTVSCRRQLKQQAERRRTAAITYSDQSADDLVDTPSSSVDVVISFQSAQRMADNGLDWKKSILEAGRVLKPGGRFLFVESAEVGGESFLEQVMRFTSGGIDAMFDDDEEDDDDDGEEEQHLPLDDQLPADDTDADADSDNVIFSEVGFDNVDMVLQPHIAGVAIKALDADLTTQQRAQKKSQEERDRLAELSLSAFERGRKKRRKKKTNGGDKKEELGMKS